jgi:hypothetical protein
MLHALGVLPLQILAIEMFEVLRTIFITINFLTNSHNSLGVGIGSVGD